MRRVLFSFFLCTCLLLTACTPEPGGEAEPGKIEAQGKPAVADLSAHEAWLTGVRVPAKLKDFLLGLYPEHYRGRYRQYFLSDFDYTVVDDDRILIRDRFAARVSSRENAVGFRERLALSYDIDDIAYRPFEEFSAVNSSLSPRETFFIIGNLEATSDRKVIYCALESIRCGYDVHGEVSLNAFIHKNEEGRIALIPDPLFLTDLPVVGKNPEHFTFDLNGEEILLDSFLVECEEGAEDFPEVFRERGSAYFYARVRFSDLSVGYDFKKGYDCTARLITVEPITDDCGEVFDYAYAYDPVKDPRMTACYRAIVRNTDVFYTDSAYGFALLDLDFDETPELLVPEENGRIAVYRITGETVRAIGSIPSGYKKISLGKKTLSDGTVGWLTTSYDEDFMIRLEDDELIEIPILTRDECGEGNGIGYCFMGERIEPSVVVGAYTDDDGNTEIIERLEWNGYFSSYRGNFWELIDLIRTDFRTDIPAENWFYFDFFGEDAPRPSEEREFSDYAAARVDEYFIK